MRLRLYTYLPYISMENCTPVCKMSILTHKAFFIPKMWSLKRTSRKFNVVNTMCRYLKLSISFNLDSQLWETLHPQISLWYEYFLYYSISSEFGVSAFFCNSSLIYWRVTRVSTVIYYYYILYCIYMLICYILLLVSCALCLKRSSLQPLTFERGHHFLWKNPLNAWVEKILKTET